MFSGFLTRLISLIMEDQQFQRTTGAQFESLDSRWRSTVLGLFTDDLTKEPSWWKDFHVHGVNTISAGTNHHKFYIINVLGNVQFFMSWVETPPFTREEW